MDLNNALTPNSLMENIANVSEYFIAANTRTSFTDLAESCSPSSTPNSSGGPLSQSGGQQFANIAPPSPSLLQKTPSNHHSNLKNQHVHQQPSHNNPHQDSRQQQDHHHNQYNYNPPLNNMSTIHSSQAYNQNHYHGNLNYSNSGGSSSTGSMQSSTRLNQPTRTQIPIHCLIEQLDACADIPGYSSPLDDTELFNTSNSIHLSTNNNKSTPSNAHHTQPYPLQSKLALESVTNCDDLSFANYNGNGNSSLTSMNNKIQTELNSTNNDGNLDRSLDLDGSDLEGLDTNLDHLGSTSPLSINLQPRGTNSIGGNDPFNNRQLSPLYTHQNYPSCRETYAIITSNVLFIDLVRTVLLQLGYSAMDLINAKGKLRRLLLDELF